MANKRLIDANALLNWLEECTDKGDWLVSQYNADWIWSMLDSAPTIDAVEVVHGRWVHPKGYVMSNGFKCSECGHEEVSYYPINPRRGGVCIADENGNFYYPPKMNYCPNCGAKMDGGNDG